MTTNLFMAFQRLIPVAPLLVGDVASISDGEALIALPSGGQIKARGAASVGDRVWVRNGVIEGQAPNLPIELIEV